MAYSIRIWAAKIPPNNILKLVMEIVDENLICKPHFRHKLPNFTKKS